MAYENSNQNYQRTKMQKDMIIKRLREEGCRITKQRRMLLDVILEEECSCCKEIYYRASKVDPGIGTATVYRMVNKLEEISCGAECDREDACTVEFDDNTVKHFSAKTWNRVILAGLKAYGYVNDQKIRSVEMQSCM